MKKINLLVLLSLSLYSSDYYFEYGKKVELTKAKDYRSEGVGGVDYYITQYGNRVGITNELIVKCEHSNCTEILGKYNLTNITSLSDSLFLVKLENNENIFEISQKLYLDKNITFATPNFTKTKKMR
jgi:hypothetical protein